MADYFKDLKKVSLPKKEKKESEVVTSPKVEKVKEDIPAIPKEIVVEQVIKEVESSKAKKSTEKADEPVVINNVEEEPIVEKKKDRRGRKPTGNAMEREFCSVNVGDGIREDLKLLIERYEQQTGKNSVGIGTYIRYLIEKDIEENKDYLTQAKKFKELLFGGNK